MTVPREIIGQFVDAAVENAMLADELLLKYPDLRVATWLGESILRFLAIENYSAGIYYLVQHGWNIDESDNFGNTILIDSVMAKAYDSVTALLELGANPNAVSLSVDNALHCAIFSGNIKMVKVLLDGRANPNYVTDIGETVFNVLPQNPDKNAQIRLLLMEKGVVEKA
ncbi:MAG: ankyrin repeat domain-containing protein [Cyanobacteria bacterium P01_G01_bin.39]